MSYSLDSFALLESFPSTKLLALLSCTAPHRRARVTVIVHLSRARFQAQALPRYPAVPSMARKAIKKITVVARAKTEFMSAFLRSFCTAYGLNNMDGHGSHLSRAGWRPDSVGGLGRLDPGSKTGGLTVVHQDCHRTPASAAGIPAWQAKGGPDAAFDAAGNRAVDGASTIDARRLDLGR